MTVPGVLYVCFDALESLPESFSGPSNPPCRQVLAVRDQIEVLCNCNVKDTSLSLGTLSKVRWARDLILTKSMLASINAPYRLLWRGGGPF